MAKGHWLDPLARSLLEATGQLPPRPKPAGRQERSSSPQPPDLPTEEERAREQVERELLALKLHQNPGLRLGSAEEVRHAAALGWRLDVNRATATDWLRLPGIHPDQVDLLLRLQAGGVQLSGPDDLQRLLELDSQRLASWEPLLQFRWYGDGHAPAAPRSVDLNRVSAAELEARLPEFTGPRGQRLLRERQRAPFQHLADLQERLQLPPELVEQLIGRVRFGRGPAGPELPRSA